MAGRSWLVIGAILGGLAVATGAFGAHSLEKGIKKLYSEPELQVKRLAQWNTGVQYHFYHVPPLLALGLLSTPRKKTKLAAGILFLVGMAGFTGGLYAMVLLNIPVLGASIVPMGGTCWIAAWICLAFCGLARETL